MKQSKLIPDHLEEVGFLSKKAGSFSGVPQRTVQLWTEKGLITPEIADTTGTGNRRLYSVYNCIEIGIIRSLSSSGLSYKIIEQIMAFLHKYTVSQRLVDIAFGDDEDKWETIPADKSNLRKLLDEDSANLTIYMLDDDDKISFSFSAMSEINSKLLPENRMEGAHILPQDQDSLSGDCDKELTINITRIAKKTIDKMI